MKQKTRGRTLIAGMAAWSSAKLASRRVIFFDVLRNTYFTFIRAETATLRAPGSSFFVWNPNPNL